MKTTYQELILALQSFFGVEQSFSVIEILGQMSTGDIIDVIVDALNEYHAVGEGNINKQE
ncbi:hypothetical protein [Dickeya poaceiphila]|uniref:Uncharacterized protein n=1 Tax=Dickeya poaceiphila TaxID=568768 RepID=A0A5B8I2Y4_9GAMM|nr:hypothetical protein [Dickeya poaceiphila]QDX29522.1 hypothetical protein Dpoa569_0001297 [Dickeya poaceiphila]